jgi:hypothetical protein
VVVGLVRACGAGLVEIWRTYVKDLGKETDEVRVRQRLTNKLEEAHEQTSPDS